MTPVLAWLEPRLRRDGWPCFITRDFDDSLFIPIRGLGRLYKVRKPDIPGVPVWDHSAYVAIYWKHHSYDWVPSAQWLQVKGVLDLVSCSLTLNSWKRI